LLLHFYGFSMGYIIMGKTNFEKTYPKEFFDAFMTIWVWKSGFNSWNQNFRKCTLFVWSTVCMSEDAEPSNFLLDSYVSMQVCWGQNHSRVVYPLEVDGGQNRTLWFFTSKNTEHTSCLHSSTLNHSLVAVSKAVTVNLPTWNPHCLLDRGLVSPGEIVMYWWMCCSFTMGRREIGL